MNKTGRPRKGSFQNSIWDLYTERHLLRSNKRTANIPKGGTFGPATAAPEIPEGARKLFGRSLDCNQKRRCQTKITQTDHPRSATAARRKFIFSQIKQK